MRPTATRFLVAAGILLAGFAYLAWLACLHPDTECLRPSLRGRWIVHPSLPVRFRGAETCPPVTFERRFTLPHPPSRIVVRVSASRGFQLDVNGSNAVATQTAAAWRHGRRVDLGPLLQTGTNAIRITVSGRTGPPALLVEGPPAVRTDGRWLAATDRAKPVKAVVAGEGEGFLRDKPGPLQRHPRYRLFLWLLGAYVAFIAYALLPARLKPWTRSGTVPERAAEAVEADGPAPAGRMGRSLRCALRLARLHGLWVTVLAVAAVAQYRNAAAYPYERSPFDVKGHVDYVRLAAEEARVPLATQGWEMFQPPGYYFAAAQVYRRWGGRAAEPASLKAVQAFGATCGLLNLVFTLGLLWLLFPDRPRVRNLGFVCAAFLPVHFYMNPMITNEVFAGAVIGGALLACCWAARAGRVRWLGLAAAGLACGAALLSKYTGLFTFVAAAVWLGLRATAGPRDARGWAALALFVACALAVSGWFYHRNAAVFGNAFIGNWDYASGFHFEQPPGYRTVSFYTRFGSVLFHDAERSRWWSFWDGQYGSLWADSHRAFLRDPNPKMAMAAAVIPWIALLPTTAALWGFGRAAVRLLRREWDDPLLALVLVTVFSLVGVIAFTMEVPTYSTIKAFFLLSLTAPAAVFAGLGLEAMAYGLGRLRWLLYAALVSLATLVLHTYRWAV